MRRSILLLCSLLLTLPALATPCHVGKVLQLVGSVHLHRQTQILVPTQGMELCQGDSFSTDANSIARLRLSDGTLITIGKNSEFAIREFHLYTDKDKPNIALFDLVRGAFRSISGLITQRAHRFEVRTAVATIGVRGTDFWGGFGLTEKGLDVIMLDGHGVYVKTDKKTVELNKPGLGTTVIAGADPQPPKVWGKAKIQRALATITP